ncbi:Cytochrome b-c1 complex subunit 7 [Basidiobolus ranarum]|uniref:Cytochrome b-c1 complex subunit 7 n=1 Tax=Basidiobolus ranarum TaxID=34480 RepID=A0ABR2WGN9_9FUNG
MSLANCIKNNSFLKKIFVPLGNAYANAAGYRRLGLRYDDIIAEESDTVREALRRLPEKEAYDRAYRLRVAMQCSLSHTELPKSGWTKPEDDIRYLQPIIDDVERECAERARFDTLKPSRN